MMENRGDLAHEEWTGIVQGLVVDVVGKVLQVVLDGDYALGGQFFDLLVSVVFPVLDVWVVAHTQRAALKTRQYPNQGLV